MQRERFYIGNCKDETAQEILKKYGGPLTAGFCEGEEWFVFIDTIAIESYRRMLIVPEMKRLIENAMGKAASTVETFATEVDENELIQKITYEINDSVLHEVSIHYAAKLVHDYFIGSIRFVDKSLDKKEVYSLIEKCDLNRVKVALNSEGKGVKHLWFEEVEKQCEKIKKLCAELESRDIKLEVGYEGKDYPIKFGLDDIWII